MIKIDNLVKTFGAKRAVDGISFTVERGEVLGFLGPNGAGKSTTMRMITGFMPPTAGSVTIGGHDVAESPLRGEAPDRLPAGERRGLPRHDGARASSTSPPSCAASQGDARKKARAAAWSSAASSTRCCASRSTRCRRATGTAPASRRR